MTEQNHDRDARQGIPLSAIYRQLDNQPAAEAAGYDPAAAVARLMTRWDMQPGETAPSPAHSMAAPELAVRHELILQLSRRRLASTGEAYAAIQAISSIAAAVAVLIPTRLPAMALAGLAVTAVLVAYAVVLIHRGTMHGMTADHDQLLGRDATVGEQTERPPMRRAQHPRPHEVAPLAALEDDEDGEEEDTWPENRPRSSRRRRLTVFGTQVAVVALIAATSLHAGTSGLIALAATGGLILTVLTLVATALFANEQRSSRVFHLLAMFREQDATARSRRARLR